MAAVPLNRKEREAAVEWLSALACIGLKADTIEVKFGDHYEGEQTDKKEVSSRRNTAESTRRSGCLPTPDFPLATLISGWQLTGGISSNWWRRTATACVSGTASCKRISDPVS